jgi:hypothetical protein
MPNDFRYSLTRLCLKSGQLTLPAGMLELFPREGEVRAVDTTSNDEFPLVMRNPRVVGGLAPFFHKHQLDVNDVVQIRPLEDGRYALTPLPKVKKPDFRTPEGAKKLVERILELGTPLSEAEIRALEPGMPQELDVNAILEADGRLVKKAGRWGERPRENAPSSEAAMGDAQAQAAKQARRATVTPYPRGVMFPGGGLNSETEPADISLHGRAREVLQAFGFRIEGLPQNQLMAHAEMGRRSYSALVQLYPEGTRLDWSSLLARRRELAASYVAVFGAHRDLLRLGAPAEMARATLWSWEALARAKELIRTVPVSPTDLEPFFQQGGLFDQGLGRFEKLIGKRIAERGAFSGVLSRLATMRAPAVFVLDDIADAELTREQALKVLELLSQAPFHMVGKVDDGEFCLRYGVANGLLQLSEYALSLRDRLPARRTERLSALPELDDTFAFEEAGEAEKAEVELNGSQSREK